MACLLSTVKDCETAGGASAMRLNSESSSVESTTGLAYLRDSLHGISRFPTGRANENLPTVLMYELGSDGSSCYKSLLLRDLLTYVTGHIDVEVFQSVQHSGEASMAAGVLRLRDLRRLDFQFNPCEERAILIRRNVILFALDPIRALITTSKLILVVPPGADTLLTMLEASMQDQLTTDMQGSHSSPGISAETKQPPTPLSEQGHNVKALQDAAVVTPFEHRAYEALLSTLLQLLSREHDLLSAQVRQVLGFCRRGTLLPLEVQEQMRAVKNALCELLRRVQGVRTALEQLTGEDQDMALMNLSVLCRKQRLYMHPLSREILSLHEPVEELLGAYLMDFTSLAGRLQHAQTQMENAEDLVSLRLDTSRNQLLFANAALAVLGCSLAAGAYATGLFGMNLDQSRPLERTPYSFLLVLAGTLLLVVALGAVLVCVFRRRGVFPAFAALRTTDLARLD